MATSATQDRDFLNAVIGTGLLETCIEWIQHNMEVQDVFPESEIESWAENNGYKKEE